jgi:hypothetical protein
VGEKKIYYQQKKLVKKAGKKKLVKKLVKKKLVKKASNFFPAKFSAIKLFV